MGFYFPCNDSEKRESMARLGDAWLSRKYPYTASKAAVHCANRFTPTCPLARGHQKTIYLRAARPRWKRATVIILFCRAIARYETLLRRA